MSGDDKHEAFHQWATESDCHGRHSKASKEIIALKADIRRNSESGSRLEASVTSLRGDIRANHLGIRFWAGIIFAMLVPASTSLWYIAKVPSRIDVSEMIHTQSPYREDRPILRKVATDVEYATRGLSEAARDLAALMQAHRDKTASDKLFWSKDWPDMTRRIERLEDRASKRNK